MTSYEYGMGADSTHKGGAKNNGGRPAPSQGGNYGGSGAVPAVVGTSSPVVVATGAHNNGTSNVPAVNKGR